MKKFLIPSMIAFGLMACSESNDAVADSQTTFEKNQGIAENVETQVIAYAKGDGKSLWKHMEEDGNGFFEDHGILPTEIATPNKVKCEDGLKMDGNTIYFDEMEGLYLEGSLVKGVCGNALNLKSGEVAPLSINMIFPLEVGTVEFWFKPNEDFYDKSARTLLGNDEARIHFFVQGDRIVFQKNHADKHFFVEGEVTLSEEWNHIAGQWDGKNMSIWVNGKMVGKKEHTFGYEASIRHLSDYDNLLVLGYKSRCCMEGPGQYSSLTTSGSYDQVRISNIPRYEVPEEIEVPEDTTIVVDPIVFDTAYFGPVTPIVEDTIKIEVPADSEEISVVPMDPPSLEDLEKFPNKTDWSCLRDHILLYEDFDKKDVNYSITLTEGIDGKAGSFGRGDKLVLDALDEEISQGMLLFYFKPSAEFFNTPDAALVGSDEGRLTIQKSGNRYYFFKNLPDNKIYVSGEAELVDGWNKFVGQWDGKSISLFINDKLIATMQTNTVYTPSTRGKGVAPYGNAILVGYKDYCCTTGDDVYAYGEFDNILVTMDLEYNLKDFTK
ncbi:LamG-like jellyroll fold domain-containing protein [Fibrobacter sp. UWEL]|uniref:LamG-like jellyroll fold domain-containing protein n=1 Tax=Fibrobacter sp. UWEL TaxID=1896209 RepID=UPI00091484D3|nr:LamG-like jellyroll fold domain-containing protein [Fibrobacter sp. UWEL]SHL13560.1 Concanavalin A-like lectin/glucanases superfamily protein [Fibrobacter sp. UWEL]